MKYTITNIVILLIIAAVCACSESFISDKHTAMTVQYFVTFVGAYMLGSLNESRRKEK